MSRTSTASHGKGIGVLLVFLSLVFLIVGIVVYRQFAQTPALRTSAWIWLLISVAALLGLGFGIFLIRRALREDRVLKTGLVGQGTVLELTSTGMGIGSASPTDYSSTPIFKVHLRVAVPGHPPYDATVREIVPLMRRLQLQPGLSVAIRADPKRLNKVVIDWEKGATVTAGSTAFGLPGVALPGMAAPVVGLQGATLAGLPIPGLAAPGMAGTTPVSTVPGLPTVTVTGTESPETLRAAVREIGLAGTASIDSVVPAGTAPDGRRTFVLGMWINVGGSTPLRVDNAPTAVEERFVHKVAVGASVPVRVALVGSAQATVLLWDEA